MEKVKSFTFNNAKVKYVSTKEQYCFDVSFLLLIMTKLRSNLKHLKKNIKG